MQGRLESQMKIDDRINNILTELPSEVTDYYLNISTHKEFRSCLVYVQIVRRFLNFYISRNKKTMKNMDFTKISDRDLSVFLKSIETKKNGDNVEYTSFSYRQQTWSGLNSFFEFLEKKRIINNNPMRLIDRPKNNDKVEHENLDANDLSQIIEAVNKGAGNQLAITKQKAWKDRDLAIIYTLIFTGMRESALCEIDMDKLDLENNILTVIDKGHKENEYEITPKLKAYLEKWLVTRETLLGGKESDALFISNRRSRITPLAVSNIVSKYAVEGIGRTTSPHRFRGAYITMIYEETNDIELASRGAKHEHISTTRRYIQTSEKEINKKVANIISSKF